MENNELILRKDLNPNLSTLEQEIVLASRQTKIKDLKKKDVANKITELVGAAFVVLNQPKMAKEDRLIMEQQIVNDLFAKFQFYTLKEVENAFYMGTRGELKNRPDEIVFMSITQVYQWLTNYRIDIKRTAMKKQIDFEARQENENKEEKIKQAETINKNSLVEEYNRFLEGHTPYDPLNVLYDFLDRKGKVQLSNYRKRELYRQASEEFKKAHLSSNSIEDHFKNKKILQEMENGSSKIDAIIKMLAKQKALKAIFQDIKDLEMTMEDYLE